MYATDTGVRPDFGPSGTDAIFKISGGRLSVLAKSTELNHPNGITVLRDGTLVVVTFTPAGEVYTLGPGGRGRT